MTFTSPQPATAASVASRRGEYATIKAGMVVVAAAWNAESSLRCTLQMKDVAWWLEVNVAPTMTAAWFPTWRPKGATILPIAICKVAFAQSLGQCSS